MQRPTPKTYIVCLACALIIYAGCGGGGKEESLPEVQTNVNLVVNPSFEEWDGSDPVGWELEHFAGNGEHMNMFGKSIKEAASGKFSYYLRGLYNSDRWMVLKQRHPVRPGYRLDFAAQMMSKNIKRNRDQEDNANIFIRFLDGDGNRLSDRYYADHYTRRRLGTTAWKRNWKQVEIPQKARYVEIGLINQMTGHIYFDDVELVIVDPIPWKKKEKKNIAFYYLEDGPYPEGAIERQAAIIDGYLDRLGEKLDLKIKYYFYPSEERFNEIYHTKRYKQIVSYKRRELHTISPTENRMIVPLVLIDMGYPPLGLAEGLALSLRAPHEGIDLNLVTKRNLVQKKIPALYKIITKDKMKETGMMIAASAWASFIDFLIDKYGLDKFKQLYRENDEVKLADSFNDVFKRVLDDDFQAVDRKWRLYVLRYQPEGSEAQENE